jgi:hypothetical protein
MKREENLGETFKMLLNSKYLDIVVQQSHSKEK